MRIAFVHGWAEGAWSASRLAEAYKKAGFEISDPKDADILIAHSAGCYFAAEYPNAKLVVLIGLPFWPGKPLVVSLAQKLALEVLQHRRNEIGWYANKLAHNSWNIISKPMSLIKFLVNRRRQQLPIASTKRQVVLVKNKDDRFCTPEVLKLLPQTKGYDFIELPGLHDDCWINPNPYVNLMQEYAKQLA